MNQAFKFFQRIVSILMILFTGYFLHKTFSPKPPYRLTFNCSNVEGLFVGTRVFLCGVDVGHVTKIDLDVENLNISVEVQIDYKDLIIYDNVIAEINNKNIISKVSINLLQTVLPESARAQHRLYSGDTILLVKGPISIDGIFSQIKVFARPLIEAYLEKNKNTPPELNMILKLIFDIDDKKQEIKQDHSNKKIN